MGDVWQSQLFLCSGKLSQIIAVPDSERETAMLLARVIHYGASYSNPVDRTPQFHFSRLRGIWHGEKCWKPDAPACASGTFQDRNFHMHIQHFRISQCLYRLPAIQATAESATK